MYKRQVLNSPISDLNLLAVSRVVDIPVIITVTKEDTNIQSRIDSGASILNVACSTDTPRVVAKIRERFPDVPIIASGGKTGESISATSPPVPTPSPTPRRPRPSCSRK